MRQFVNKNMKVLIIKYLIFLFHIFFSNLGYSIAGQIEPNQSASSAKTINRTLVLFKDQSITSRQLEVFKIVESMLTSDLIRTKTEEFVYYSQFEFRYLNDGHDKGALNRLLLIQLTSSDANLFSSSSGRTAQQKEEVLIDLQSLVKKYPDSIQMQITQDEINQIVMNLTSAMGYLKFRLSTMQASASSDIKDQKERNLKLHFENLKKKNKVKFL